MTQAKTATIEIKTSFMPYPPWLHALVCPVILMSWGPPHAVLEDGSGGRILVYTENRMYVSPGYSTTTSSGSAYGQVYGNQVYVHGQGQSNTTYTPAQVHQWQVFRQFRVNSSGQITQYSLRGL